MYYNVYFYALRAKHNALGALGLVSTVANAGFQDYQNRKNREFSQEMLQEQQLFQRELNANSALVQKQSLQRAGLNPNMLSGDPPYGSSSALGDSSPQVAPHLDANSIVSLAQMEQQKPLVEAQVNKTKAEENLINKQAGVAEADEVLKKAQAFNIQKLTPEQYNQLIETNKKIRAETEKTQVDSQLVAETILKVSSETVGQKLNNDLLRWSTPYILQKYASEISLLNKQGSLTDAQTLVAYKSLSVMNAEITELISRAHLNEKQAIYVSNLAFGVALDNQFKPFEQGTQLELQDWQIQEIKSSIHKIQTDIDFAPLDHIIGSVSGAGVAFGAGATGLNQYNKFMMSRVKKPAIGFNK